MSPRRATRLLALLAPAWLMSAVAFAQDDGNTASSTSTLEAASAEEIDAYRDTATRFTSRMREFEEEARDIIQSREQEDKAKLRSSYEALLEELGEDERRLRETAISKFEGFLTRYPDLSLIHI